MGFGLNEFSKFWCYVKNTIQSIPGPWDFTFLTVKGSNVLTQSDLSTIISQLGAINQTGIFAFNASTSATPTTLTTQWDINFYPFFKNGEFLVQFLDDNNNLQDRPDIGLSRVIDRTSTPTQTGLILDSPFHPAGQVVIKYLNFPLV